MKYRDQGVHELKEGDVFCPQCSAPKVDEAITCRRTEVRVHEVSLFQNSVLFIPLSKIYPSRTT